MILLFSERHSKREKEITDILKKYGFDYYSDTSVYSNGGIPVTSLHRIGDLSFRKGIAVFCDDTEKFNLQRLPSGTVAICESSNNNALNTIKQNRIAGINCGTDPKSTVTVSSLNKENILVFIQRNLTDINGNNIEPGEYNIKTDGNCHPFSAMASAVILLLSGINP